MQISDKEYKDLLGWAKGKLCYKGTGTALTPIDIINEGILMCYEEGISLIGSNIKNKAQTVIYNEIGHIAKLIPFGKIEDKRSDNIYALKETNKDLVCKKCKEPKPESCFRKSTHKNGYVQTHSYCIDCERVISKICERKKRARRDLEAGITIKQRLRGLQIEGLNNQGEVILKFISLSEAEANGFNRSNIVSCIKGRLKRYKGFIWQYVK